MLGSVVITEKDFKNRETWQEFVEMHYANLESRRSKDSAPIRSINDDTMLEIVIQDIRDV